MVKCTSFSLELASMQLCGTDEKVRNLLFLYVPTDFKGTQNLGCAVEWMLLPLLLFMFMLMLMLWLLRLLFLHKLPRCGGSGVPRCAVHSMYRQVSGGSVNKVFERVSALDIISCSCGCGGGGDGGE